MSDKTLAALTAATPATGGFFYGTQEGADRKFTLSPAGAALMEGGIMRAMGTMQASTAGTEAIYATFTLDFSAYVGGDWVLNIGGTDYDQSAGDAGVAPVSISLPDEWGNNGSGVVTHNDPGPQDVSSISVVAAGIGFFLDFSEFDGASWIITVDGVDYEQPAGTAAAAPESIMWDNLDWNTSNDEAIMRFEYVGYDEETDHTISAYQVFVPPTMVYFTDGDDDTTSAQIQLDFSSYNGTSWILIIDSAPYAQVPSALISYPGSLNLPEGWSYYSGDGTVTNGDASSGHSASVAAAADAAPVASRMNAPTISETTDGQDGVDGAAAILEVVLVAAVSGKKIKLLGFGALDGAIGGGLGVALYLRSEGVDTQITSWLAADQCSAFGPYAGALDYALNGKDAGESLVAKLFGSADPEDGSTCTVGVIFEVY